jgi:glycine dehydrogenase subunit 1
MQERHPIAHPFMPNSLPEAKAAMLKEIGAPSIDALFAQIPADHRYQQPLSLPDAIPSEADLRTHLLELLNKNTSCEENLSFLGGGCWRHYVPAVCDEIVGRSEFLTSVWGTSSSDHGRNQAWFEFCSQLGELLGLEMVGLPVYSWGCAAGHALRMASRMTQRRRVLVPRNICPERLSVIRNYCGLPQMAAHIQVDLVDFDRLSGLISLTDLKRRIASDGPVAAVYLETPSFLGLIEPRMSEIATLVHNAGAEFVVGVDPVSLGVLAAPADYGADIVVGSIQPLGIHMHGGGGLGGFISSRDEPRYAYEYPTLMLSITDTIVPGETGFGMSLMQQSSYGSRELGKDWTGNSTYLWAIASAVYMSMLGPAGFQELGNVIAQRSHYAAKRLAEIEGIHIPFASGFFKEFVVNVDETGRTIADLNSALLKAGIFGGQDVSTSFPDLGQSALYCITELHTRADIDRLASAIREWIRS